MKINYSSLPFNPSINPLLTPFMVFPTTFPASLALLSISALVQLEIDIPSIAIEDIIKSFFMNFLT